MSLCGCHKQRSPPANIVRKKDQACGHCVHITKGHITTVSQAIAVSVCAADCWTNRKAKGNTDAKFILHK